MHEDPVQPELEPEPDDPDPEPDDPEPEPDDPDPEPDEPEDEFEELLATPLHVELQSKHPDARALSSSKLSLQAENIDKAFIPTMKGKPCETALRKKARLLIISDLSLDPISYLFNEKILHVNCRTSLQLDKSIGDFAALTSPCS